MQIYTNIKLYLKQVIFWMTFMGVFDSDRKKDVRVKEVQFISKGDLSES